LNYRSYREEKARTSTELRKPEVLFETERDKGPNREEDGAKCEL
jgi:hypothetical protein